VNEFRVLVLDKTADRVQIDGHDLVVQRDERGDPYLVVPARIVPVISKMKHRYTIVGPETADGDTTQERGPTQSSEDVEGRSSGSSDGAQEAAGADEEAEGGADASEATDGDEEPEDLVDEEPGVA
jgi:hypothetical protein